MLDELEFTNEEGEKNPCDITVYALSTCGFCKRGLAFLRDNNLKFKFIYVDQLAQDLRMRTKKELSDKYKERIGFPFVVVDNGNKILVGFKEVKWKEAFEL